MNPCRTNPEHGLCHKWQRMPSPSIAARYFDPLGRCPPLGGKCFSGETHGGSLMRHLLPLPLAISALAADLKPLASRLIDGVRLANTAYRSRGCPSRSGCRSPPGTNNGHSRTDAHCAASAASANESWISTQSGEMLPRGPCLVQWGRGIGWTVVDRAGAAPASPALMIQPIPLGLSLSSTRLPHPHPPWPSSVVATAIHHPRWRFSALSTDKAQVSTAVHSFQDHWCHPL